MPGISVLLTFAVMLEIDGLAAPQIAAVRDRLLNGRQPGLLFDSSGWVMVPVFLSFSPITVGCGTYIFDVDVTHFMKVAKQPAECVIRFPDILGFFSFSVGFISDLDVEIDTAFAQFGQ
jgi:hypothetical protein